MSAPSLPLVGVPCHDKRDWRLGEGGRDRELDLHIVDESEQFTNFLTLFSYSAERILVETIQDLRVLLLYGRIKSCQSVPGTGICQWRLLLRQQSVCPM